VLSPLLSEEGGAVPPLALLPGRQFKIFEKKRETAIISNRSDDGLRIVKVETTGAIITNDGGERETKYAEIPPSVALDPT
jgi:hypothetical protein